MKRYATLLAALLMAVSIHRVLPLTEPHSQERRPEASEREESGNRSASNPLDPSIGQEVAAADHSLRSPGSDGPDVNSAKTHANIGPVHQRNQDSLDTATPARIRDRLQEAIEHATQDRDFSIDSRVVEIIQTQPEVPIIVGGHSTLPDFGKQLFGTRHTAGYRYRHIPYAAVEAGPQALLELIRIRGVDRIELDERHHPTLAESVPLIFPSQEDGNGFDGTGYDVVIIDTGVEIDHPAFRDRVTDEACFSRQGDCPGGGEREFGPGTGTPCSFGCSHGTLVAGIALGMDDEGIHHGIARDAGLITIQVFSEADGEPAAWTSDILAALEHVYDLSLFHPIAAVSMSLGGGSYSSQSACDQANSSRKAMIDQLRSIGIPTIVSSGNEGESDGLSSPACISSAISVGSTQKNDSVSSYSNSAEFLSLLAPGHRIRTSAVSGGYRTASGTSMATPHVSGAIAVIREAVPESSLEEILFALQYTGVPVTDARNELTVPRIDVAGAIEFLGGYATEDEETSDPTDETNPQEPVFAPSGDSGSCGLVGLEILFPLFLTSRLRLLWRRRCVSPAT